jgi:3-phosphoshikimate 1-carboxyvinyltransferase
MGRPFEVFHLTRICSEMTMPGDKSITHRLFLLGAVAAGRTKITGALVGFDCQATIDALTRLGVTIEQHDATGFSVLGQGGATRFRQPETRIHCGNSGTTARLFAGLVAAAPIRTTLTGDASLRGRPMGRIIRPLQAMGAGIECLAGTETLPLTIQGRAPLAGGCHTPEAASAQVKSAILLAGLGADGPVTVRESRPTRDHTERLLQAMGISCASDHGGNPATMSRLTGARPPDADTPRSSSRAPELDACPHERRSPTPELSQASQPATECPGETMRGITVRPGVPQGGSFVVPGDLSSAAPFITAAAIQPGSHLVIRGVGLNPTRTAFLDVLRAMGAEITVLRNEEGSWEPVGDLEVRGAGLRGIDLAPDLMPGLIDELPVLAAAMAVAEGSSTVRGAAELRHKESDRIASLVREFRPFGLTIEEFPDGFAITGSGDLTAPTASRSHGDHRIAMALAVLGSRARGTTLITDAEWLDVSCPGFHERWRLFS